MNSNQKINLVMFSMSSYSEWVRGVENRNYHLLQNLVNDPRIGKIITIDYLPHTYRRLIRNYWENILAHDDFETLKRSWHKRVFQVNEKLIVYSSVLAKFSKKLFYQKLKDFLKKQGFDDYLVWSYYPLEVGYFTELKPKLFIFDAVDNWLEHPSYWKFGEQLKKNYQLINEQADLIFILASAQQSLFSHQEKVHKLPNAVDLKHYQREYPIINRDIGDLPRPIIGYVGTVQDRFDLELYEGVVKRNPKKSFVIVGPIWYKKIKKRLANYQNVYLLGRKSYTEVPMYLQQFEVGIIPHQLDNFSLYTNPMKIYEYLACGKPVVTTETADIEDFKELVYPAATAQEFAVKLDQAILENSPELVSRRLEVIKEHSWLKRTDKMLSIIFQKLN